MSNTIRPVDRQKLDQALAEAGQRADAATRAQIEAFEAVLRGRGRKFGDRRSSLNAEVNSFIMPDISDAGIFRAARSIELLNHVIEAILPRLGADEDISAIARAVIAEEIERRVDTEGRLAAALLADEIEAGPPVEEQQRQTKKDVAR